MFVNVSCSSSSQPQMITWLWFLGIRRCFCLWIWLYIYVKYTCCGRCYICTKYRCIPISQKTRCPSAFSLHDASISARSASVSVSKNMSWTLHSGNFFWSMFTRSEYIFLMSPTGSTTSSRMKMSYLGNVCFSCRNSWNSTVQVTNTNQKPTNISR